MAGWWTGDRDENRNWRSEGHGGREQQQQRPWRRREDEGRSFDDHGARLQGPGRDRVFGEEDTGAEYNNPDQPKPTGGFRADDDRYGRGGWQRRDYQGVSPAMQQGEYDLERHRQQRPTPRFQTQDYTQGGRFYGDDGRQPIYRQEYGQGGVEYGREPRGYDAGGERSGLEREMRRPVSGGTGGYDYEERGYGDGGRSYAQPGRGYGDEGRSYGPHARGEHFEGRGERFEDRARQSADRGGDFLQRAGERLSSWFSGAGGGDRDRGRDEGGDGRYSADFGRERRWDTSGHRGRGPKGYTRPDERITDEVHERLTEDPWVDASNISVSVSGGEVTLSGTVDNREAKHRAERCVEEIPGVNHVQNNLRVDRGGFLTSPSRGYGDSVLEKQMRDEDGGTGTSGGTKSGGEDSASTRTTTRRT